VVTFIIKKWVIKIQSTGWTLHFCVTLQHSAGEICEIPLEIYGKKPWINQEFLSSINGSKIVERMLMIMKEAVVQ